MTELPHDRSERLTSSLKAAVKQADDHQIARIVAEAREHESWQVQGYPTLTRWIYEVLRRERWKLGVTERVTVVTALYRLGLSHQAIAIAFRMSTSSVNAVVGDGHEGVTVGLDGRPHQRGGPASGGRPRLDLQGMTFGRLTVLDQATEHVTPSGGKQPKWLCRCTCGTEKAVMQQHLVAGNTESCGCRQGQVERVWTEWIDYSQPTPWASGRRGVPATRV